MYETCTENSDCWLLFFFFLWVAASIISCNETSATQVPVQMNIKKKVTDTECLFVVTTNAKWGQKQHEPRKAQFLGDASSFTVL